MKGRKKILIPAGVILVLLIVITVLVLRSRSGSISAAEMTVKSAQAETGSISTTVTGTGSLASGASTDVVVPEGIKIKEVLVKSGDTVTAGQTLATVDEASVAAKLLEVKEEIESVQDEIDALSSDAQDSSTTEYLQAKVLEGEMSDLTKAETSLTALMETQAITAACAGTLATVNVSADSEVSRTQSSSAGSTASSAESASDTVQVQNMAASQTAGGADGVILLSCVTEAAGDAESVRAVESANMVEPVSAVDKKKITDCGNLSVTAPEVGGKPQEEIAQTDQYTGTVTWNCSTAAFQADTVYTATVKLTAKDGYEFSDNIIPEVAGATVSYEVLKSDSGESILKIKAKFAKTGADTQPSDQNNGGSGTSQGAGSASTNGSSAGAQASGTGSAGTGAASGASGDGSAGSTFGGSASGSVSASGSGSGGTSGSASTGSADTGSDTSSQYSTYEAVAFGIASGDQMMVSINVDELDILSVKAGQTAAVTQDALEDQEFEGKITKVASSASSGSSSTKYEAQITLDKTDDMLLGMSASATIHIDEAEDAVLIPVSALQEKGGSTFVYTKKDSEDALSGEMEVETGLSDGSNVEITSGISKGDTVYYLKAESTDSSETQQGMMGGKGGQVPEDGQMPSGGQMPNGGEMPDRGEKSQK